jgi:ABC-type methionine transport system permease subunit
MNFNLKKTIQYLFQKKDLRWTGIWLFGIIFLVIWNLLFLNTPDLLQIQTAIINTFLMSLLVVIFSVFLGWIFCLIVYFLGKSQNHTPYTIFIFSINIIRSIPQIIGILLLYILITQLMLQNAIKGTYLIMSLMAFSITMFQFLEIMDLLLERINYYSKTDFFNALLVCGVKELTIINKEIFIKNSRKHILNKLIALFGSTIFLQCSIDFILSIGLSTKISSVNFPLTLGNLLARIDSKQDILAIGHTIMNPTYFTHLFFEHLQGITISFIIVFTLLCIYKISNAYMERLES